MIDARLPSDEGIREQLARRSAGRLPDGLLDEVSGAIDEAAEGRTGLGWPRVRWTLPRLAAAGVAVALVSVLAVAVAMPALHLGPGLPLGPAASPAGYPAGRALTTLELADILAGPALPANTALVAAVTIDSRQDVCPMNRYPTIGVIEGMHSQVCVMGSTVSQYLSEQSTAGVFAFRYLAPGVLGLLGQITTPSESVVSFQVDADWPLEGKTLLVEGWLGADELAVSCAAAPVAGDVLSPNGSDCPYDDWLADEPDLGAASPTRSGSSETARPSWSGLPVPKRHVEAGGVHMIDAVPWSPIGIHGVYVVRSVTEACPGDPSTSSRGCPGWRVLARVADLTSPSPSGSASPRTSAVPSLPTPTLAPPATPIVGPEPVLPIAETGLIGPDNLPFTQAQTAALIAADPSHLAGRYLIDERVVCDGTDCSGFPPRAVVDQIQPDESIGLMGLVEVRPDAGLVWTVPQVLDAGFTEHAGAIYIVDAWISGMGADSCDVAGQPCYEVSWLGPDGGGPQLNAQPGDYQKFGAGSVGGGPPIHGLFLVQTYWDAKTCSAPLASSGSCSAQVEVLARLESVAVP